MEVLNSLSKGKLMVLILSLLLVVVSALTATKSYFNNSEISMLVDSANARGVSYELTIHNAITNSYTFETVND